MRGVNRPADTTTFMAVKVASKSGAEATRTLNLQLAKLALYQLSYRPNGSG